MSHRCEWEYLCCVIYVYHRWVCIYEYMHLHIHICLLMHIQRIYKKEKNLWVLALENSEKTKWGPIQSEPLP